MDVHEGTEFGPGVHDEYGSFHASRQGGMAVETHRAGGDNTAIERTFDGCFPDVDRLKALNLAAPVDDELAAAEFADDLGGGMEFDGILRVNAAPNCAMDF